MDHATAHADRPAGDAAPDPAGAAVQIRGHVLLLIALDIGFQVDLDAAAALVGEASRESVVRARRPAPEWFDYSPKPLRLVTQGAAAGVAGRESEPAVEILVYDFGAASLTYRFPLPGTLAELPRLSTELHGQTALEADARQRIEQVMEVIRPAIDRPRLCEAVEDYIVFAVTAWADGVAPSDVLDGHRQTLARAIEGETAELSPGQAARATGGHIAYTPDDLAIIDWNAAVLFDHEPDDVIAVLQHANVELLEFRVLDAELDAILDQAPVALAAMLRRRVWPGFSAGRMLGRFGSVQTDAAVMFEGVNNAIKLLGNQYLARLYRLAATRLDLPAWQAGLKRKLEATESLYQKMSDAASGRRLETLEWVIILLIAVSIILPFTPWY